MSERQTTRGSPATEQLLAELRERFSRELPANCARLKHLASCLKDDPGGAETLAAIGRELHRLQGTAGTLGLHQAAELATALEARVNRAIAERRPAGITAAAVRRFIASFGDACRPG